MQQLRYYKKNIPHYILSKIHRAATQVVAGTNYFLILEFKTNTEHVFWEVILYEDFSGEFSLVQKKTNQKLGY